MSASADKVQYILESCLQQSIALVRRGIFSQQQLQSIMHRREKCENAMLKRQYKMTDYLGSIQYQYQIERQRRKRVADMTKLEEGTNPFFKKQSSSDYAIVKRIIRLWDRTMHKFKFQLRLWKQYLSFTLAIASKKHFYKALTNALRFLPFQVDLWKIGAAYQMEHGMNMWKGRKILIKGLKMIPSGERNLSLSEFMINYEFNFLRRLLQRRRILIKGQAPIKIIGAQDNQEASDENQELNQEETINLEQFDDLVWLVIEEAISKNCRNQSGLTFESIKYRLTQHLRQLKNQQENPEVQIVIQKVINKLNDYDGANLKMIQNNIKQQNSIKIEVEQEKNNQLLSQNDLMNFWKERMLQTDSNINWQAVKKGLTEFCLKPKCIADIYDFLLQINKLETIKFIQTNKQKSKLPVLTLLKLISLHLQSQNVHLSSVIKTQIDRWLTPSDLKQEKDLFQKIVRFNAKEARFQSTTRLLRSLSIAYRHEPDYLAYCNKISSVS